jgi:hypothetical protein
MMLIQVDAGIRAEAAETGKRTKAKVRRQEVEKGA